MRGYKLDVNHDLSLDAGGRLEFVDGVEATAQEIKTRLLFMRGEAFTDLREGVPYYTDILVKGVDPARVRALIRQTIQSVPSVVDVPRVDFALDPATRTATVTWEARHASGRVIRSEDFPPLILGA